MTCDVASRYGRGNDAVPEQHITVGYEIVALAVATLASGPARGRWPFWKIVDYRARVDTTGQKKPAVEKKLAIPYDLCLEPVVSSLPRAEFKPLADIGANEESRVPGPNIDPVLSHN
jgi:hypothetical protein